MEFGEFCGKFFQVYTTDHFQPTNRATPWQAHLRGEFRRFKRCKEKKEKYTPRYLRKTHKRESHQSWLKRLATMRF